MLITYQHEPFISQALDSILSQKFSGSLQVVVGIDKCSDRTADICRSYQERFPHIIQIIEHSRNIGMYQNFYETMKACTGKYISILEGDDYWADLNKLQLQFNLFECFPSCVLSAGSIITIDENSRPVQAKDSQKAKGAVFFQEDLIIINRLSTLTTAFRADAIRLPEVEKLGNSPHLDWSLYISLNYPPGAFIYKFRNVFGAYRVHSGGVYSLVNTEKRNQNVLKSIFAIHLLDIGPAYRGYIKALFANFTLRLANKEVLEAEPYKSFFDPSLIIYGQDNRLKKSFIQSLRENIRKRNSSGNAWKMDFGLLRQTRPSLKTFLEPSLLPLLPSLAFLGWKDEMRKKKLYKEVSRKIGQRV